MMTIRKIGTEVFKGIFLNIPLSLVIALAVWFIGSVIFSVNFGGFLSIWKWTYIIFVGFTAMCAVPVSLYALNRLRQHAAKIGAALGNVEEAVWKYHLAKKNRDFYSWDIEKFSRELTICRQAAAFAEKYKS